jgi:ribonuclease BN (tRNA processing enzyme)
VGDGRYVNFIRDVDLLVHERNFSDEFEKVAIASGHCTSCDILRVVQAARPKKVALTHFNPLTPHDPLLDDDLYEKIPGVISALDEMVVEF